jgi:hypothetical protein
MTILSHKWQVRITEKINHFKCYLPTFLFFIYILVGCYSGNKYLTKNESFGFFCNSHVWCNIYN